MSALVDKTIQRPLSEDEKDAVQRKLLLQSFGLLREHADTIINTPAYSFCSPRIVRLALFYIGGGRVPLGALLQLWQEGKLIETCPVCSGEIYLFSAGGSPLSGMNAWSGICPSCNRIHIGKSDYFPKIWQPMQGMIDKYSEAAAWSKVEAVSFEDLLEALKAERN